MAGFGAVHILPGQKSRPYFSDPCALSSVGPVQPRPPPPKTTGTRVTAKLFNPQLVCSHSSRGPKCPRGAWRSPYNVECFSKGTDSSRAAASSRNQQRAPVRGCTMAAGSDPSSSSRMRCVRDQDRPQSQGRASRGSHCASVQSGEHLFRLGKGYPTGSCSVLRLTPRGLQSFTVWNRICFLFLLGGRAPLNMRCSQGLLSASPVWRQQEVLGTGLRLSGLGASTFIH